MPSTVNFRHVIRVKSCKYGRRLGESGRERLIDRGILGERGGGLCWKGESVDLGEKGGWVDFIEGWSRLAWLQCKITVLFACVVVPC